MLGQSRAPSVAVAETADDVIVHVDRTRADDPAIQDAIARWPNAGTLYLAHGPLGDETVARAATVVAVHPDFEQLGSLMARVAALRQQRADGLPVLVIGITPADLTAFGGWLSTMAAADRLDGIRLIVDGDPIQVIDRAAELTEPVHGPNLIAMPRSTEVENSDLKYFYCISPKLRALLAQLSDLARNNVTRLYLLGGPGAGKTSLAYFFYLARGLGNFVTVNLTAESTEDKAAMKSLLCGHVSGAFPGAGSRTGAFSHARDGVCFLDESHGVYGSVKEVLMEALDAGQYLPYGASAKRPLECAIVFASNRHWAHLLSQVNLDEHARMGAVMLNLADLAERPEDLIAVLADTLSQLARRSTSWQPPAGLTEDAWEIVRDARWRGNTRTLIRVVETAFVECAMRGDMLIDAGPIYQAMEIWEPAEHSSHELYTSSAAATPGLG